MAEGRVEADWTAALFVLTYNINRGKAKALQLSDVNPYAPKVKPIEAPITVLRDVFCK